MLHILYPTGNFGTVSKAWYMNDTCTKPTKVAIKTIKGYFYLYYNKYIAMYNKSCSYYLHKHVHL